MGKFKNIIAAAVLAALAAPAAAQYTTGRVAPTKEQFEAHRVAALARNGLLTTAIPDAKEAKWDSREHGWIGPIKNQGNCGSCWCFDGTGICEVAHYKAGVLKPDQPLSEQYTLSCYENGGCNGDDHVTVLKHARRVGLPLTKDYGAYRATEGRCNYTDAMKRYAVDDWGFADGDAGYEQVGSTQKIKNAIKEFGACGVAIAADNAFMNSRPGQVFRGSGSRQVNHEVILVAWDDTLIAGKTVWTLRNSWGTGWCDGGYSLILEGANQVGTEPVWARVDNPNPPPPPVPPAPPAPPTPGPKPEPAGYSRATVLCAVGGGAVLGAALMLLVLRKVMGTFGGPMS